MSAFADIVTSQPPQKLEPVGRGKSGALLATYRHGVRAIVKVTKPTLPNGHKRQRGIEVSSHPRHEVAFYQLAKLLGFEGLVPETVLTTVAVPGAVASAQQFYNARALRDVEPHLAETAAEDWGETLARTCLVVPRRFWRQLLVLDVIAGSRDRHANNVGVTIHVDGDRPVYRVVAWDNAVSFGKTFDRYHNVFHKFLFRRAVSFDHECWDALAKATLPVLEETLAGLVEPEDVLHAHLRAQFFLRYPYRLPWKVCSRGHDSPHDFPHYAEFFEPVEDRRERTLRISA